MYENIQDNKDYSEIARQIRTGQPVWVPRDTESSFGSRSDLFSNGRHKGFVDMDDQGADAYAYIPNADNPEEIIATRLNDQPLDYFAASNLLEQFVSNKPL